jgi:multidrug efflux pump subunit AcrA (membrane-fusion protein)
MAAPEIRDGGSTPLLVREPIRDGVDAGAAHAEQALRRRRTANRRVLLACLGGIALIALVSFWAGSKVHGHGTSLPKNVVEPVPTAPVEHGRLVNRLQATGTVVRGGEREITPLPLNLSGAQPVVTKVPVRSGSLLVEGRVVAEVAGRPTIVLLGAIPMYRDLAFGAQGGDVAQFQRVLERLGYRAAPPSGWFDASTAAAAEALFRDRGYDLRAFEPGSAPHGPPPSRLSPRALRRIVVPASSIVYLTRLPARVAGVDVRVGDMLHGPLLSVSAGAPRVRASVDPAQAPSIRHGMPVAVSVGLRRLRGRVLSVGSSGSVTVGLRSAGRRVRVGAPVRLTIELGSSKSAVWSVPYSAVFTASDGSTFIRLAVPGHHWRRVPVRLGFSANGYVAIRAGGVRLRANESVAVAG